MNEQGITYQTNDRPLRAETFDAVDKGLCTAKFMQYLFPVQKLSLSNIVRMNACHHFCTSFVTLKEGRLDKGWVGRRGPV